MSHKTVSSVLSGIINPRFVRYGKACGILSVNTQARRFGSLLYVIGKIRNGIRNETLLQTPSESEVRDLQANFRKHGVHSGEISTKKWSIIHYMNLANELHLLTKQGSFYDLTAHGKLLSNLNSSKITGPYPLQNSVKHYLLASILNLDFYGIKALISILLSGRTTMVNLRNSYQESLLRVLKELSIGNRDSCLLNYVKDRSLGINDWSKPVQYADHLVSARLNWLADLDLICLTGNSGVNVDYNQKQESWLKYLHNISCPTETDICDLLEKYNDLIKSSELKNIQMLEDSEENLYLALDKLFKISSNSRGIQKVRTDVATLFLMSKEMDLLKKMKTHGNVIFDNSLERNCKKWKYRLNTASRLTESYIIRYPTV